LLKRFKPFCITPEAATNLTNLTLLSSLAPPPQDEDEYTPAAKKPRLDIKTSAKSSAFSSVDADTVVDTHAADILTTASPCDTVASAVAPTDAVSATVTVTAATSSPSTSTVPSNRAIRRKWKAGENALLIEAYAKFGKDWAAVAAHVPGRSSGQCCDRWHNCVSPKSDPTFVRNKGIRWTPEEDANLTEVAAKLSNDWARVATLVPGRSHVQCRQRWVNYLDPTKDRKSKKKRKKGEWTVEDGAKLAEAVAEFGKDKVAVAAMVPGRMHVEYCQRFIEKTTVRRSKWTPEEDSILVKAIMELGNDWARVAAVVPGRTGDQCIARWHKKKDLYTNTSKWTDEEDAKLTAVVTEHGTEWARVASLVPGRSNDQCRHRWATCLDPTIDWTTTRKGKWSGEEDAKLTAAVAVHGNDWVPVAAMVPGRTGDQCRYRWIKVLEHIDRTLAVTGKWSEHEDAQLTAAVTAHGKDWVRVAALVPGRSHVQCCKRWGAYLNPTIDRTSARAGKWTLEENALLVKAVKDHGVNNWNVVAARVPGRSNVQCHYKWDQVLDPARNKGKWKADEIAKLKAVASELGKDWVRVAARMPGRTNMQCRERWNSCLTDTIDETTARNNKGLWSGEEEAKLISAVKNLGNDWVRVAAMVPGRTNAQCHQRWVNILDESQSDLQKRWMQFHGHSL
jgi:hypothetical protein